MSEQEFNAAMGGWMRNTRKRLGLSQEDVAARLGVHRNTISRWENGDPLSAWDYRQLKREFELAERDVSEGVVVWSLQRGIIHPPEKVSAEAQA